MTKIDSLWRLVGIAWQLGYSIALPLVFFAFGGVFLDRFFHSSPLFFLIGVIVAIIISTVIVVQKINILINDNNHET